MKYLPYILLAVVMSSSICGMESTAATEKSLKEIYLGELQQCRDKYDKGERWDTERLTEADMAYLLDRDHCRKECLARYQAALTVHLLMIAVERMVEKNLSDMKDKLT